MKITSDRNSWLPAKALVLHAGLSKTGTSSLQRSLKFATEALASQNYAAHSGHEIVRSFENGDRSGRWSKLARELRDFDGRAIFSCERLARLSDEQVEALVADLGGDVHVLLTVRAWGPWLVSLWQEKCKHRAMPELGRWLESEADGVGKASSLRGDRQAQRWARLVGPERVCILPVSAQGGADLHSSFEELIGLAPGSLLAQTRKRSLSAPEINYSQDLFRSLRDKGVRVNKDLNQVLNQLANTRQRPSSEPTYSLPKEFEDRCHAVQTEISSTVQALGVHFAGSLEDLSRGSARKSKHSPAEVELPRRVMAEISAELVARVAARSTLQQEDGSESSDRADTIVVSETIDVSETIEASPTT